MDRIKVKTSLYEVYTRIKELRETRDIYARLVADEMVEGNQESVEHFIRKYKHFDDVIEYLAQIEVEYEDKYESEEEE
ncbi:hypothetical protein ABE073_04525 [Lederbergia citrisecunda]|uniref:hypothetical protein n=1 Tax=Lederbergia citrisecunda TaxID=2833583 RepID=UPI003D2831EE